MSNFIYYQSITQYRVDVDSGKIEHIKGFTVPIKGVPKYKKPPKEEAKAKEVKEEWI